MTLPDFAILFAFVAYGVWAGFAARRRASAGLDEYFLAGRSLKGWQAGASMAATQFAADTPLLVMGLIAVGGVASLWRLWIYGLAFLFMGFVLGAAWRRAGVLTDAEFTMIRYGGRGATAVRALKAVYYGTVINCTVMAFVLVAASRIFEVFLPWHEWLPAEAYAPLRERIGALGIELHSGLTGLDAATATTNSLLGIAATVAFVGLYSTTGGLRSVVRTDILQLALMLAGTAAYAVLAVDAAGGLGGLGDRLEQLYGAQRAARLTSLAPGAEALAPFLTVLALQWIFQMNADGTGYLAQRTMACASDRDAERAAVTFTLLQIVVRSLLWLLIGLALLVLYPLGPGPLDEAAIAARESLYALGAAEMLPAGLRGLLITSLLAALASTIDTHLNWGASYWANDLYRGVLLERWLKRAPRPRELVFVARASTVVLLALALALMTQLGSIQTAWQISLLFGAGVGAVLVLRWLWERVNLLAEAASIVVSLLLAPPLLLAVEDDWLRLLLMAVASTAAVVAATLFGPAPPRQRLAAFYARVRPPGFWSASAAAAGAAPGASTAEFKRRLGYAAACAVSTYAWLVGATEALVGSPGRATLLLALGFAAAPLWWRALRNDSARAREADR
jgi:Na+/proline symporter